MNTSLSQGRGGILLAVFFTLFAAQVQALPAQKAADLERYLDLYNSAAALSESEFRLQSEPLKNHLLFPYLEYAWLKDHLGQAKPGEIERFLDSPPQIAAKQNLRVSWLTLLANRNAWSSFATSYRAGLSESLDCQFLSQRVRTNPGSELLADIGKLWLVAYNQDPACDRAFSYWTKHGQMTQQLIWKRLVMAAKAGESELVRQLGRKISGHDRVWISRWQSMRRQADNVLKQAHNWPKNSHASKIIAYGLHKLAPGDPKHAYQMMAKLKAWLQCDQQPTACAALARRIAVMAATDYLPQAGPWLKGLAAAAKNDQSRAWQTRVALRKGDWHAVLDSINAMPKSQAADDRWRYWRGRALAGVKANRKAIAVLSDLAKAPNYFGFAAADRLGQGYSLCPELRKIDDSLFGEVWANTGLQRALMLFRAGQWGFARVEWARSIRNFDRQKKRHAAILAAQEGWWEKSIETLGMIGEQKLYSLRFPTPWGPLIEQQSKANNLDKNLVYSIIRAESLFAQDAISRVGAQGLMQLMPKVAQSLASSLGLSNLRHNGIMKPGNNIRLGTHHLASYLSRFADSPVLAAAAYNAGPDALEKWLAGVKKMPADIWIETIAYKDTRSYVAQIMAFWVVYDWRDDGRVTPMRDHMPAIGSTRRASLGVQRPVFCRHN